MTTLKTAVVPARVLKSGKHRIRIAVGHKHKTKYMVTRFEIDNISYFRDRQVTGTPNASYIKTKLRNLMNSYQEAQLHKAKVFHNLWIFISIYFVIWLLLSLFFNISIPIIFIPL